MIIFINFKKNKKLKTNFYKKYIIVIIFMIFLQLIKAHIYKTIHLIGFLPFWFAFEQLFYLYSPPDFPESNTTS